MSYYKYLIICFSLIYLITGHTLYAQNNPTSINTSTADQSLNTAQKNEIHMRQWALNQSDFAVVIQHIDRLLHMNSSAFGLLEKSSIPAISMLRKHFEQIDFEKGDFEGFDLKRGFGLFANKKKEIRFVVAVHDHNRFLKSLQNHLHQFSISSKKISVASDHVRLGPINFSCQIKARWWVCDTSAFTVKKSPTWADDLHTNVSFWSYLNTKDPNLFPRNIRRRLGPLLKMSQGIKLQFAYHNHQSILQLDLLSPSHPLQALVAQPQSTSLIRHMSELTPFAYKLDLPLVQIINTFAPMFEPQMPSKAKKILNLLKQGFDGSLSFSFVKDITRPLVSIGFTNQAKAQSLLDMLTHEGVINIDQTKDLKKITLPLPNGSLISIYCLLTETGLYMALEPGDLRRIAHKQTHYSKIQAPKSFNESHIGFFISQDPFELIGRLMSVASLFDLSHVKRMQKIPFNTQKLFNYLYKIFIQRSLLFLDSTITATLKSSGLQIQVHTRSLPNSLMPIELQKASKARSNNKNKKTKNLAVKQSKNPTTQHAKSTKSTMIQVSIDELTLDVNKLNASLWSPNTQPNVMVEIKANNKTVLKTVAQLNKDKISWSQSSKSIDVNTDHISIYIYHKSSDNKAKLAAIRVRPKLSTIDDGLIKSYKGKGISKLTLNFKILNNSSSENIKYIKNYQAQFATQLTPTSSLSFSTIIEDSSSAADLYRSYINLKLKDLTIEAQESLVQLISRYPKSIYSLKARRILF
jgi:hypothetical protein